MGHGMAVIPGGDPVPVSRSQPGRPWAVPQGLPSAQPRAGCGGTGGKVRAAAVPAGRMRCQRGRRGASGAPASRAGTGYGDMTAPSSFPSAREE